MNVASTIDRVTSLAPVSKMKCSGKPLIWHLTLQTPSSLTNGTSLTVVFNTLSFMPKAVSPSSDFFLNSSISALNSSLSRMLSRSESRLM